MEAKEHYEEEKENEIRTRTTRQDSMQKVKGFNEKRRSLTRIKTESSKLPSIFILNSIDSNLLISSQCATNH